MKVAELLNEGVADKIQSAFAAIRKIFKKKTPFKMPANWQIEFNEANKKGKLDPMTWQVAFMAGALSPEESAADSFQKAYYGANGIPFPVEEATWKLGHAAGVRHSKRNES